MPSFNIYIPSYRRSNRILTAPFLDYCVYVVRESERDAYEDAGVEVLSVEDHKICSIAKVQNWIIENTPEDVVAIIDDDISGFMYRTDTTEHIGRSDIITREIERLAQMTYDLGLGYCSPTLESNPKFYNAEFKFVGIPGQIKIINKDKFKARYDEIPYLSDIDVVLYECLKNRAILFANYFVPLADMDTNSGGSNDSKTLKDWNVACDTMARKWGKYFKPKQTPPASIAVKR